MNYQDDLNYVYLLLMYVTDAIDVVIPSFRLDENILLDIINVDKPLDFKLNFYVVADNPDLAIPGSIQNLAEKGTINLVVNDVNMGFSKTRNKGINLGNSKWVLLLDDDIVPERTLITAYAEAISKHEDAVGFAGVTNFPKPFNDTTLALELNGNTGHCKSANDHTELMWVPTTNIMLNRVIMDKALFSENLKKGGEDIEFLVRNALLNHKKYIAVPDAQVEHPWWEGGTTKRLFRYGAGAAQIAPLPAVKNYTYHEFTNTSETLLLLIVAAPFIVLNYSWAILFTLFLIVVGTEFVTNCVRTVYLSGIFSIGLSVRLFWIKNCYETGYLTESILSGRPVGFAERIDMSFSKEHPSWFRLNKWKIIKMSLIAICLLLVKWG